MTWDNVDAGGVSIKNPSYVHTRPLTKLGSGRGKNARQSGFFCDCVHSSNAISRMAKVENKQPPHRAYLKHIRYVHFHWTSGHISEISLPSGENLCPLKKPGSGQSGHISGEVTL